MGSPRVNRRPLIGRRPWGVATADSEASPQLLALIEHASIVERILRHLGLPTDRPEPRPARAPPRHVLDDSELSVRADRTF